METIKLKQSFLAAIQFQEEQKTLFLTLKSGKQYKYPNFTKGAWMKLKQANNKGSYIASYIATQILSGPKAYQGEFVRRVDPKQLNQNTNFQKFLALWQPHYHQSRQRILIVGANTFLNSFIIYKNEKPSRKIHTNTFQYFSN